MELMILIIVMAATKPFGVSKWIQTTSAACELNRNCYAIIAKQRACID